MGTGFEELSSIISDFQFDIIGISETWLSNGISSDRYKLPGYDLIRSDRQGTCGGGGVAIFIRNTINFRVYSLNEVDSGLEHLCVIIKSKGVRLGVCVIYRPPGVIYTKLESLF